VASYYAKSLRVPLTSNLSAAQRASLKAQYQAAVQKAQKIMAAAISSRENSYSNVALAVATPSVTSPAANQSFLEGTPVPIKVTTPKVLKATALIVNLEKMDAGGVWRTHATLPVGVSQAQSATGYTGFGAGAPPAFLSLPGRWRLNAQVTAPQASGPSPWVEFSVRFVPTRVRARK
jgi:hypothetical protein